MKSLLEHMKAIYAAHMMGVWDNKLWYQCRFQTTEPVDLWELMVGIPLDDLRGGFFPELMYVDDPGDGQSPKLLQRWIRKTLEEAKEQEEMITKARAEWNSGE